MKYLAHALHKIAVVFEVLAHGDNVGGGFAEMRNQIPNLGGVGACAGHDAGARRRAHGLLHVGAVESHSLFADAVDIGTFDVVFAVNAELRAQVVDHDEHHIGSLSGKCHAGSKAQ